MTVPPKSDLVVLVAGLPGSGKTALSEYLSRKGFSRVTMGDVIRRRLMKRGAPVSVQTMMEEARALRRSLGPAGVAILLVEELKEQGVTPPLVVDGVRSLDELAVIAKEVKGCHVLVYVHANPMTRFLRLLGRGREGDPKSVEEFLARDKQELGFGLAQLAALADFVVVNEGSVEELYARVEEILGRIRACSGELLSRYL